MLTRFVPFEEIDKNKWNGTVHYAAHGNIYGYHWYLKSVVKEWDAIIEGDYQSVMPIFRSHLTSFQKQLLPEMGPYTVNAVTESRSKEFFALWEKHSMDKSYVFNHAFTTYLYKISDQVLRQGQLEYLDLSPVYDDLMDQYPQDAKNAIIKSSHLEFEYAGQGKPDPLLENEKLTEVDKSTLYRLFYNATHRGSGWHSRVINLQIGLQADAFILSNQKDLYISYLGQQNEKTAELKLLDTLVKSNAGRPCKLFIQTSRLQNVFNTGMLTRDVLCSDAAKQSWIEKLFSQGRNH